MTYHEAIDALADDPHAWRYRELTAEDHENPRVRDAWRERVVRMANGEPEAEPTPVTSAPSYPSLARQAWNASKAAGRVAAAAVQGQKIAVDRQEQMRRLALCKTCLEYDAGRCKLCGCVANWKTRIATEHCPKLPPLW